MLRIIRQDHLNNFGIFVPQTYAGRILAGTDVRKFSEAPNFENETFYITGFFIAFSSILL